MEIGPYKKIEDLDGILKRNDITIPMAEGWRLMEQEAPLSKEEKEELEASLAPHIAFYLCSADPFWDPKRERILVGREANRRVRKYLMYIPRMGYSVVRWDRIHGRMRKILKFEIKKAKRLFREQCRLWDQYAGQPGVLCAETLLGGRVNGDISYKKKREGILRSPYILAHADDPWDGQECDIYVKFE